MKCGKEFETVCNLRKGHRGVCGWMPPEREYDYEYPPDIKDIYDRCQANVISFDNDEVSTLLVEIDRLAKGKR